MSQVKETKVHSEEHFGEWRDFWWNRDFVELMAKRWNLSEVKSVLDVGCGFGHWGRIIQPFLPVDAHLIGVDREAVSVARAAELAAKAGFGDRSQFRVASAEELPFADNSFDMVTCQTVLIHVPDVGCAIAEMKRVLKPGGLLAVVEPNNSANCMVESSVSFDDSLEARLAHLKLHIMCERGKASLGLGHNSIGDLVPKFFLEHGILDVQVHLSDKTSPSLPPYASHEQQVNAQQTIDWIDAGNYMYSFEDTLRYYLAAGGTRSEFHLLWEQARQSCLRTKDALMRKTLYSSGGVMSYLISGRKA